MNEFKEVKVEVVVLALFLGLLILEDSVVKMEEDDGFGGGFFLVRDGRIELDKTLEF